MKNQPLLVDFVGDTVGFRDKISLFIGGMAFISLDKRFFIQREFLCELGKENFGCLPRDQRNLARGGFSGRETVQIGDTAHFLLFKIDPSLLGMSEQSEDKRIEFIDVDPLVLEV